MSDLEMVLAGKLRSIKGLQISVTDKEVILEGYCRRYYDKQIAQHQAMASCPGKRIINHIEVRSPVHNNGMGKSIH